MVSKYKTGGWYKESYRHSLARRGISTKKSKSIDYQVPIFSFPIPTATRSQRARGFQKVDEDFIDKFQNFIKKKFGHAKLQSIHKHKPEVQKAEQDIGKINSFQKFRQWYLEHENTVKLLALGGVSSAIGAMFGGVPVLVTNAVTGEFVAIGGSAIGQAGAIGNVVLTGLAIRGEAKFVLKDEREKLFGVKDANAHDFIVETPNEEHVLVIPVKRKTPSADMAKSEDSEFEDLSKLSSPRISYDKLSDEEKLRLNLAVNQVRDVFSKMGQSTDILARNINVVERVGKDDTAWGASQGNLIQIDRDIIHNEDKLQSVLAHEVLHKEYDVRDKTRALENIQMDMIGKLMKNGVGQ